MLDHVSYFAEESIVRAFGYLLENYEQNSPCLNDCIMTMLHHIAGQSSECVCVCLCVCVCVCVCVHVRVCVYVRA